jgi:SM-20-related protein
MIDAAAHRPVRDLELVLSHADVAALGDGEVLVRDGLLGDGAAAAIADELAAIAATALRPAAIGGRASAPRLDRAERGDELAWLERAASGPALAALWRAFDAIGAALRRDAWLPATRFEVQLARYAPGARYTRHRDAFGGGPSRIATAIYYLNAGWRAEHGGALRVHRPRGARDISPQLDRLALFLSDRVEHEVLEARAARLAITAWYHGREALPRDG